MGIYDGGQVKADGSAWTKGAARLKNGEVHPEPAKTDPETGKRKVTPDPYVSDNPHVLRNFGHQGSRR